MVLVQKDKNETKDSLFRRFVKTFLEENVVEEYKKKLFYKKPSLWKKEKKETWEHLKKIRRRKRAER